jgi:hypothetical protein
MASKLRQLCACLAVFVLSAPLFAAGPTAERIGALSAPAVSNDLRKAVEDKGYRVTLDDAWTADFWFARAISTASQDSPDALCPELSNGEFIAIVNFTKGFSDFRGQALPSGLYTLRYQYLPQDANHMGVSPNPDFLLAIPVADDANPTEPIPFNRLVSLSAKATGTAHPAVIAMAPAGIPATISKGDQGITVLTVEVPTSTPGKTIKLGVILKGQASVTCDLSDVALPRPTLASEG